MCPRYPPNFPAISTARKSRIAHPAGDIFGPADIIHGELFAGRKWDRVVTDGVVVSFVIRGRSAAAGRRP
jgi:hypothetical protein